MPPTYYVIELSARWLTVLLVSLALALVMAFAFGYGAAWSVLSATQGGISPPVVAATPAPEDVQVVPTTAPVTPSVATPVVVASPTAEPTAKPTSTPPPAATPAAAATPATTSAATAAPVRRVEQTFWVQVLAAGSKDAMDTAQNKLAELGFPTTNQRVVQSRVAGGNTLYKLRVGPFPDRASADRVVRRMQSSGFPDAWVVLP